ncbi:MAG: Holliday junction resolvase RuvX [Coriobacteriales bacterium]|jgi:putative Holliday junction resolvase
MRVLAIDIGEKRIGVAAGDTSTGIAVPLKVLPAAEVLQGARTWRMLIEDNEPELIVSGLPVSLDGSNGKQAEHIRAQAEGIAKAAGLALEFSDERLSSKEAKRILREQGLSEREMRGRVDSVAASLFLETWLAQHREA